MAKFIFFITFSLINTTTLFSKGKLDFNSDFKYRQKKSKEEKKGVHLMPFLSLLLPGFDQYIANQMTYGLSYTSTALLGYRISQNNSHKTMNISQNNQNEEYRYGLGTFGRKLQETAGSLSAYHSFKTRVRTRPYDFPFLKNEDSISEILLAPFNFKFFKKSDIFIPLTSILVLRVLSAQKVKKYKTSFIERINSSFNLSYLSAVGEESLFRGWLMPLLHYDFDSPIIANTAQSLLFGLAHYQGNSFPLIQTLMGFYLGHLSQKSYYSLKESIFLHHWWNVIILTSHLLLPKSHQKEFKIELLNLNF